MGFNGDTYALLASSLYYKTVIDATSDMLGHLRMRRSTDTVSSRGLTETGVLYNFPHLPLEEKSQLCILLTIRNTGAWENGMMHGQGTLVWVNGDKYEPPIKLKILLTF